MSHFTEESSPLLTIWNIVFFPFFSENIVYIVKIKFCFDYWRTEKISGNNNMFLDFFQKFCNFSNNFLKHNKTGFYSIAIHNLVK